MEVLQTQMATVDEKLKAQKQNMLTRLEDERSRTQQ